MLSLSFAETLMSETDEAIARASEVLERHRINDLRRASGRSVARAARATRYSLISVVAIALSAFFVGLIVPIGTTGVMIAVLAMCAAVVLSVMLSREREVALETLTQAPLKMLPAQTARWLDAQRPMLPAPAQTLMDGIGVKLQALSPQLATLDEREPAAAEVRRLIADELPALVKGYERVPHTLRRNGLDGLAPDKQLIDGLGVVNSELSRMSEQLARGDLQALATQGKYLELKYQGDPIG